MYIADFFYEIVLYLMNRESILLDLFLLGTNNNFHMIRTAFSILRVLIKLNYHDYAYSLMKN